MFGLIITLGILSILFWIGFKITGALFTALFWLCIKLPLAICFCGIGLVFFITIIFIPLGKGCFNIASSLVMP